VCWLVETVVRFWLVESEVKCFFVLVGGDWVDFCGVLFGRDWGEFFSCVGW
jgi:hypothetical protein